ncbi:hypothetical protein, partial [Roseinatronobacter ekhonensis]|uniref:hypothetical protein n=1 Tax=Roseinatronobacter ekhonensis TaxID=254356 RepID=UPI001C7CC599
LCFQWLGQVENISAFRPMSELSTELSTGFLFFYLLFFYFRAKKLLCGNGLSMVTGTNRGTTGTNRG